MVMRIVKLSQYKLPFKIPLKIQILYQLHIQVREEIVTFLPNNHLKYHQESKAVLKTITPLSITRLIRRNIRQRCARIGLKLVFVDMEINVNSPMVIRSSQKNNSLLMLSTSPRFVLHSKINASALTERDAYSSMKTEAQKN